jgi:hypothetical protein
MGSIAPPNRVWRFIRAVARYFWYLATMLFRPYSVGDVGFGSAAVIYRDRGRKLLIEAEYTVGEYGTVIYADKIYDYATSHSREPKVLIDERPDLPPPAGFARIKHLVLSDGLVRSETTTLVEELGLMDLDPADRELIIRRTVWVLESLGARVLVVRDRETSP